MHVFLCVFLFLQITTNFKSLLPKVDKAVERLKRCGFHSVEGGAGTTAYHQADMRALVNGMLFLKGESQ